MSKLKKGAILSLTLLLAMQMPSSAYAYSKIEDSESLVNHIRTVSKCDLDNATITDKAAITETDFNLEADLDKLLEVSLQNHVAPLVQTSLEESDFTLLEAYEDENEKVISYQVYNDRYILHYYPDGTILKTVTSFSNDEEFIYCENYNNKSRSIVNSNELLNEQYEISMDSEQELEDKVGRASIKRVEPKPLNVKPTSAVLKTTYNKSFPALKNLGYDQYQFVRVYESSLNFNVKRETVTVLKVKSHYDLAASWWNIATTTAKGFLSVAGVIMDTKGFLEEACQPVREQEKEFSGGIEVTVYDPTTHKSEVEVIDAWGIGIYSLGFDRVYNGFANARWSMTAAPVPFNTSYSIWADKAQDSYNKNIINYGRWIHGKGRLGY